jgi:phosphotransferase system HPr (HPr) family protein
MNILMLAAGPGAKIEVTIRGHDADEAMDELAKLIESRFGE